MAKSFVFALQKGGVGKTTISGNVARIISKSKKVLLVDADPQGSLTSWLLNQTPRYELADVLQGKVVLSDAIIPIPEESNDGRLALVPTFGIGGELRKYAETALEREPYVFEDFSQEASKLGFEVVIYDSHPGDTRLERSIILGSSEAICPVTPEYLSIDGIEIFKSFLQEVSKGFKRQVTHNKLILNMVNHSFRRHSIYENHAKGLGFQLYEIAQDSKLPEAQMVHQFLSDYAPESRVIPELERLSFALMEA